MTPARSLAASVVALGFAGTIAAPLPAEAAPAPCERADNYAAQSGAEALRIDNLELRAADRAKERPTTKNRTEKSTAGKGAADRILGAGPVGADPTDDTGEDADTISEGIGILGKAVLDSVDPNGTIPRADDQPFSAPAPGKATRPDAGRTGGKGAGGQGGGSAEAGGQGGGSESGAKTVTVREVGLGEARTALIGPADVKSAAIARVLDGKADGKESWTKPVVQQAPPTHAKATTRTTAGGQAGPVKVGAGEVSAHARWDDGMACGRADGEAARSQASLRGAGIVGGAGTVLARVPEQLAGVSTTALEGRGEAARSVAAATVTAGRIELAGGRLTVRVLRPPSLSASASATDGGEVRYEPALIEVTGAGITTKRLSAAGESAEFTLPSDRRGTEAGLLGSDLDGLAAGGIDTGSALPLPHVPGVPAVTMPPAVGGKSPESAPATGSTRVRIGLGELRRAQKGHAVAARATAVTVSLVQSGPIRESARADKSTGTGKSDKDGRRGSSGYGTTGPGSPGNGVPGDGKPGSGKPGNGPHGSGTPSDEAPGCGKPTHGTPSDSKPTHGTPSDSKPGSGTPGDGKPGGGTLGDGVPACGKPAHGKPGAGTSGYGSSGSVSLDLAFGLMEAAAVAPERETPGSTAGGAAGLPITGPRLGGLVAGGAALLVAGVFAVVVGMRRRRTR